VKVLTGVRRSGKSSLLKLLKGYLLDSGIPQERIIEIDYEFASNVALKNPDAFTEYLKERLKGQSEQYLFIDEVQELTDWAKTVNGIRAEFAVDIYVTGSNARMFLGEHLTYLSGRYVKLDVYPLSLLEYAEFKGLSAERAAHQSENLYDEYVSSGALPAVALTSDHLLSQAILDGLYDSVFSRDIILRGGIRNESAFMRVASYVLDTIGSQVSAHGVAKALHSVGRPISVDTVDAYLKLMCDAHLLYRCPRYNIRGKEYLKTNGKYYVIDMGLRNRVLGQRDSNRGHVTENVVFLELLRRGFEVSMGVLPQAEIDFVVQQTGERFYVQVCETVLDPTVLEREVRPFTQLNDAYPRVLITKDRADYSHDGIRHINLYDFLLGAPLQR
jgi:predicted AAA+ superfamily ATPase